eukprot:scaffold3442_cov202-Prasinococcus_capsulatus_cf.AAC.1
MLLTICPRFSLLPFLPSGSLRTMLPCSREHSAQPRSLQTVPHRCAIDAPRPHARLLDTQRLLKQRRGLRVPPLLSVQYPHLVERRCAVHALAPHARLLDLQRLRVHSQRLL